MTGEPRRPGFSYYAAVVVFLAVLAFAVLGLVRSSSVARFSADEPAAVTTPGVTPRRPVPTAQIPPPTRSAPTQPPSRTYLHPPPELGVRAEPEPAQPRR